MKKYFSPKDIVIGIIRVYQRTLSPDHSYFRRFNPEGFCRYQPTCSDYAILAIEKHGALKGAGKGFFRIMRCNPWSQGGLDLP